MTTVIFLFLIILMTKNVFATPLICSVCTIAVASGLGLAKLFGVSDLVVGLWMGAILLTMSQWTVFILKKKNINNNIANLLVYLSSYLLIVPLYLGKTPQLIFNENKILFIDSFLFSVIMGSIVLFSSIKIYQFMKSKNGRAHFPFEKVALPIVSLCITSILFHFLTK